MNLQTATSPGEDTPEPAPPPEKLPAHEPIDEPIPPIKALRTSVRPGLVA